MNIGSINPMQIQSIAITALGAAAGGPVGSILAGMQNMQQASQLLGKLAGLFGGAGGGKAPAADISQRPQPFSVVNISVTINNDPMATISKGPAQTHFAKAPTVGGEGDWGGFNKAVNDRITGSDANKGAIGMEGNIWTNGKGNTAEKAAIGWAMQQDDRLKFDADSKQFYTTNQDGSTKNVCSLNDMVEVVNKNGGANQSNGAGFKSVGNFIEGLLKNEPNTASTPAQANQGGQQADAANPYKQIMELIDKLIKMLTGQGGAAGAGGAVGGSVGGAIGGASGISGGGGTSSASGAGGSGSASGSGGATGAASGGGLDSMVDSVGGNIDKMMGDAEGLMKSDKQSDQLKGQQLMQKAMRLFEMISKLLEQRSQMASKAIAAIK